MMPSRARRCVSAIEVVAAVVLGSAALAAEELAGSQAVQAEEAPAYGTLQQSSLAVWSYQFQGKNPFGDNIIDDGWGYRTMTDPNDSLEFIAGINLPSGVYIEQIELDNCDNQPDGHLVMTLNDSFGDHQFTTIAAVSSTNLGGGCGRNFFTLPTPYLYPANLGHYLSLYVDQSMIDPTLKFRGAIVTYRRAVSPAPATATFNDVPTGHPFFRFVEALAKSGITGGCSANPPLYCPDNPVTRGQMAVFLSIALGLHWAN
jgi:hypothetical protein